MLRYKENLGYYLKKAANELLKNNLSEAFKIYSRILIEIPNFTDALYGMYKVYLKEKNTRNERRLFPGWLIVELKILNVTPAITALDFKAGQPSEGFVKSSVDGNELIFSLSLTGR